ncbi:cytochrome P450 family protein [Amycolatopsis tolypomycina]|uniref:cytochrome P450 family protein n=1 Tax=Amycolatopsis tolypomycina TaxID=208445 RepID=UPI0033A6EBF7
MTDIAGSSPVSEMFTADFRRDPYPTYARLRESGAACPVTAPHGFPAYVVTRYEDARAALADPRLSKDMYGAWDAYVAIFGDSSVHLDDNMINSDGAKHTRLRRLVNLAFTPRRVEALRPRVQAITDELLDRIAPGVPVDLMAAFGFPLPITVICELLGVPEADRADVQRWSATVAHTGFDEESTRAQQEAEGKLHEFLVDLIARKRAERGDDLLGSLVSARDDDRLDERELVSSAWLLLFAGHETTGNLIGNSVFHLLQRPDRLAELRARPELLPQAVEELLRFDGPAENATFRYATEELRIGDQVIPRGALVQIAIAAANRDPARFPDPDTVDFGRNNSGHLGFGHGAHYCLGASLARMEAQIALATLFARFPGIQLAVPPEQVPWLGVEIPAFRGLAELPVLPA